MTGPPVSAVSYDGRGVSGGAEGPAGGGNRRRPGWEPWVLAAGALCGACPGLAYVVLRELQRVPTLDFPPPSTVSRAIPPIGTGAVFIFLTLTAGWFGGRLWRMAPRVAAALCLGLVMPAVGSLLIASGLLHPRRGLLTLTAVLVTASAVLQGGRFLFARPARRRRLVWGWRSRSRPIFVGLLAVTVLVAILIERHEPGYAFSAKERACTGFLALRHGPAQVTHGTVLAARLLPVPGRMRFAAVATPGTYAAGIVSLPRSRRGDTWARLEITRGSDEVLTAVDIHEQDYFDKPFTVFKLSLPARGAARELELRTRGTAAFVVMHQFGVEPGAAATYDEDVGPGDPSRVLDTARCTDAGSWRKVRLDGETRNALVLDVPGSAGVPLQDGVLLPTKIAAGLLDGIPDGRVTARIRALSETGDALWSVESPVTGSGWIDVGLPAGSAGRPAALEFSAAAAESDLGWTLAWADPLPRQARDGEARPNIVLISIDTLRADAVGCYGNRGASTPAMDRLASRGVLFEECVTASTWTLPSHVSMFSGLLPSHHTVWGQFFSLPKRPLPETIWLLAAQLRRAGYRTLGATGGGFVSSGYGMAAGFDRYYEAYAWQGKKDVGEVLAKTGEILERELDGESDGAGEPFFLFVHTLAAHLPYGADPMADPAGHRWDPVKMRAAYQQGVELADRLVGGVVDELDRRSLSGRTWILLTSDHGEEFGENEPDLIYFLAHGNSVYEEVLHVPLVVTGPGVTAPRRISEPVSLCDMAPTAADIAGVGAPAEPCDGMSLGPWIRGTGEPSRRIVLAEQANPARGESKAARQGPVKMVRRVGASPEFFLYDVLRDPTEVTPASSFSGHDDLRAALGTLKAAPPAGAAGGAQSPELLEQLRALGYAR